MTKNQKIDHMIETLTELRSIRSAFVPDMQLEVAKRELDWALHSARTQQSWKESSGSSGDA